MQLISILSRIGVKYFSFDILAEGAVLTRLVYFLLAWRTSCSLGATLARLVYSCSVGALETSAPPKCATVRVRRPIGFRPPSDRIASAVQSDSVRRLIGLRSGDGDFS